MIDFDFISLGEYSVQTDAGRVFFYSLQDAERFIQKGESNDSEED